MSVLTRLWPRRALPLLLATTVGLAGCIVQVEREADVQAPVPGGQELPDAEPRPLQPASDTGIPGGLGWALLGSSVSRAVVEVDYAGDADVSQQALDAIGKKLRDHGGKSVEWTGGRELPEQDVYSRRDLLGLVENHRDRYSGDGAVALYVLVLPGRFEIEGAPGVAFHATAFALFPEQISGRLPPAADVESFEEGTAVHELGHLFGLVNLTGQGGFHEDPDHPGHSADEGSPMHWAVESTTLLDVFSGGPPSEFTEADRREMEAIAGTSP